MEVRNAKIFSSSSSWSLLRSWVSCMMKTFGSLVSSGDGVLFFALGIGLTVCPGRVCFGLTIVSVGF